MWVLSAPLFNDKTQGINARLLDNNIKDWTSGNTTSLDLISEQVSFSGNNQTQLYTQSWNNNLNPVNTHKHSHEKSRNRHKRQYIEIDTKDFGQSVAVDNEGSAYAITATGKLYYVGYNLLENNAYLLPNVNVPVSSVVLVPNASISKPAAVYLGTENGIYYRKYNSEEIIKIKGLDEAIQSVAVDNDGGAWTLTASGKVYWIGNNEQIKTTNAYLIGNINVPVSSVVLVPNASISKPAAVYLGTENGIYYRKYNSEEIIKIKGLDEAIQSSADKLKSRTVRNPKITITTLSIALLIRGFW
jgi:hypothetical protein